MESSSLNDKGARTCGSGSKLTAHCSRYKTHTRGRTRTRARTHTHIYCKLVNWCFKPMPKNVTADGGRNSLSQSRYRLHYNVRRSASAVRKIARMTRESRKARDYISFSDQGFTPLPLHSKFLKPYYFSRVNSSY